MVQIRVSGTSEEVARAVEYIKKDYGLQVRDISGWYPNRGSIAHEGRVYIRVSE